MKSYRLEVLRREFPFLDQVVGNDHIGDHRYLTDIKIRRGDKALLARTGTFNSWSSVAGGHNDFTDFFSVRKESEEYDVHKLDSAGEAGTPAGTQEYEAESIGDQLFALEIAPDFVVEFVQNDTDDYGNGKVTRFVTIHKMNRFDLAGYHSQQIDQAAAELKAEVAAVCSPIQ